LNDAGKGHRQRMIKFFAMLAWAVVCAVMVLRVRTRRSTAYLGISLLALSLTAGLLVSRASSLEDRSPKAPDNIQSLGGDWAMSSPRHDLSAIRAHLGLPVAHTPFVSSVRVRNRAVLRALHRNPLLSGDPDPGRLEGGRQVNTASSFLYAINPTPATFVYLC
jgi:hypothetical protein